MKQTLTNSSAKLGVLLFSMPYAPPVPVKQVEKVINILGPHCEHLFVVGDQRINLSAQPSHIRRQGRIPTLHYIFSIRPKLWSVILWIMKLIWVLVRACCSVIQTRKQVDVVICYKGDYYTPILLCARLLGKKTIIYVPNDEAVAAQALYRGTLFGQLLVFVIKKLQIANRILAHRCVIQSYRLIDRMNLQDQKEKVRLGKMYVDTERYQASRPLHDRPLTVGFIGRLNPQKGIIPLLHAAILMDNKNINFKIVGDGVLRNEIENLIEKKQLSHVELVGWANNEAVVHYLNEFRLLVLPTLNEGVPNVVLEAMACGTPVLATGIDGIPDLIEHNVTGFVLANRSAETIAQSITEALACAQLADMAQRGRKHVIESYSLRTTSNEWGEILSNVMESNDSVSQKKFN